MTRRDRTTGLPTESRTGPSQKKGNFFRSFQVGRYVVIALTLVLLFFIIGFFVYRIYEKDNWGEKTILEVGDETFSLQYYADRFFYYAQSNSGVGVPILQESLLFTLENEALIKILAEEKGMVVDENLIDKALEALLGVPKERLGKSNPDFEMYLEMQLEITGMQRSSFERFIAVGEVEKLLLSKLKSEMPVGGDLLTFRSILVATEMDAVDVLARIQKGDNMGSIAQTDSLDRVGRQNDGLTTKPPSLIDEKLLSVLENLEIGDISSQPIQLDENLWAVIRYEELLTVQAYSEEHLNALARENLDDLVKNARARVMIKRNLSSEDLAVVEDHTRVE
tara:strand:- start:8865 stop:9875 length:1011 start_codon:yes stop_codon:yes gene_type:complete